MKIVVALLMISCAAPLAPKEYQVYQAPPIYQQWWDSLETCSGLHGDLSRIRWAAVPTSSDSLTFKCGEMVVAGCWIAPHSIYMAEEEVNFDALVKHEMLHDLLQSGEHPSPPFLTCTNGI